MNDLHHHKEGGTPKTTRMPSRLEAKKHIASPILSDDVEIEICWATRIREGIRADIDNIIKPTLDALIGIAFDDDKRVRSVTSTLIDRRKDNTLAAFVEYLGPLLYVNRDDAVQIAIYSDTRLAELGGENVVRKQRNEEFDRKFTEAMKREMDNAVGGTQQTQASHSLIWQARLFRLKELNQF